MECDRRCPISTALKYIGRKWSIELVKDLFYGVNSFTGFLQANPELSGKVLSQRLKELEEDGIISKNIASKSPLRIEYALTKKGRKLNKVIYELAVFALEACPDELSEKQCTRSSMEDLKRTLKV